MYQHSYPDFWWEWESVWSYLTRRLSWLERIVQYPKCRSNSYSSLSQFGLFRLLFAISHHFLGFVEVFKAQAGGRWAAYWPCSANSVMEPGLRCLGLVKCCTFKDTRSKVLDIRLKFISNRICAGFRVFAKKDVCHTPQLEDRCRNIWRGFCNHQSYCIGNYAWKKVADCSDRCKSHIADVWYCLSIPHKSHTAVFPGGRIKYFRRL